MWLNQAEIEWGRSTSHSCPNVQKGWELLARLVEAVNNQSDGWHSWPAPSRAAEKLMTLLKVSGQYGTITETELKQAITPIRTMVTRQKKLQAKFGNTFEFQF